MKKVEFSHWSYNLNRNMNIKIYGHYGVPFLVFPCQDKQSDDFENFGMIENLKDFLEDGKIKLICVDAIDYETFSNSFGDKNHRAYMQEQYYKYIIDEVLPILYDDNGGFTLPYVTGCSMGAAQASIMFFRRPDLFAGIIALSGCYEPSSFFDGWCNDVLYNNSPVRFISNMSLDHPYINQYNSKKMIFCVGGGAFEELVSWSHYLLKEACQNKGINAWFDEWGNDVSHDWYWWKIQYRYFILLL